MFFIVDEESLDLTQEQVEVLENRLKEANRRADEADAKGTYNAFREMHFFSLFISAFNIFPSI